jgi:SMI1 / KNR4 family (SUKH-1)
MELPGATRGEIEQIEADLGISLPVELRTVLERTRGVDPDVDLTGRTMDYEDREVFPSGLPIAADGAGNFWVLDVRPDDAPLFFASHDPPAVVYLATSVEELLREPRRVPEVGLFRIWRENPGEVDLGTALEGDDELRAFAEELDERFLVVDLRSAAPGDGFAWGRFGAGTDVRRHGYSRLFAYAPPSEKKRRGLFRR